MRIAMLAWESLHSILVGGVGVHVSELSRALASDGHDVHVFTRSANGHHDVARIDDVTYHRYSIGTSPDLVEDTDRMCAAFVDGMHKDERRRGRFDIVHGHDWLTTRALTRLKQGGSRRCVFSLHSTEYGRCGNVHWEGRSRPVRDRELEGACLADKVLAVSRVFADEVRRIYGVPKSKMHVVYNGIDVRRFDIPVDVGAVKHRYGLGVMDPTVLFCGRMAWQKGPDLLLEAIPPLLAYYPHAKFLFVGDGEMRRGLKERARQMGVSHATRFLGFKSGRELVELYKCCDAVCVPSRNEPFGIVVLEAWAAGKPVVVSVNGGPREVVTHGVDGLHIYDNADSVGWGLGTLFMDFDRAREMGREGRRHVERRFGWARIAREVGKVYSTLDRRFLKGGLHDDPGDTQARQRLGGDSQHEGQGGVDSRDSGCREEPAVFSGGPHAVRRSRVLLEAGLHPAIARRDR